MCEYASVVIIVKCSFSNNIAIPIKVICVMLFLKLQQSSDSQIVFIFN